MPPVPQASSILASLGQAAFVWDIATDAHRLERQCRRGLPRHSGRGARQRRRIRQADRAGAFDPLRRARPDRRRRVAARASPYRIEYGVRDLDLGAGDLDRGDRLLVRRPRRQAGARAGHRPHQQRAPRPRRAAAEAVAARSADRRTQPHPSDRRAGRGDRGSHALPLVLRLHADRHRSSGARQRRLRLRRRRRRDRRSRQTDPRAAARRRRARALLRQQVRADPEATAPSTTSMSRPSAFWPASATRWCRPSPARCR